MQTGQRFALIPTGRVTVATFIACRPCRGDGCFWPGLAGVGLVGATVAAPRVCRVPERRRPAGGHEGLVTKPLADLEAICSSFALMTGPYRLKRVLIAHDERLTKSGDVPVVGLGPDRLAYVTCQVRVKYW